MTMPTKPTPRGRPPMTEGGFDAEIHVDCTMKQKTSYVRAARGQKLNVWIRKALDAAAKEPHR